MVTPEKPIGGTELMYHELMSRIDSKLLENISLFNYLKDADFNKTTVFWNQLSYDQQAVQFLTDEDIKNKINYFVFVSHWQAEKFRNIYNIPGYKIFVIKNAAGKIPEIDKVREQKIKICYTSTPWRGLDILLDAWEILKPDNCELHIFSSTSIYGKDFESVSDHLYQELYDKAKSLENVVYRGFTNNDDLRKELPTFDIMAYPCTFEETSCIAVIEALSAGLKLVTSNIGALPETTEGWADMYTYKIDKGLHVRAFTTALENTINNYKKGLYNEELKKQIFVYKQRWSWENRMNDWTNFLSLVQEDIVNSLTKAREESWNTTIFNEVYRDNEYSVPELTDKDIIIDIGAHIGSFAKRCLDNGAGKVVCFEPSTRNLEMLRLNLSEYSNIEISEKAVWCKSGLNISFNTERDMDPNNSSLGTAFTKSGDIRATTISLDDVLQHYDKIRLLKIDAEGAEYPILYCSSMLDKVQEIVGELHDINTENSLDTPLSYTKECNRNDLLLHLKSFGFEVEVQQTEWQHTLIFRGKRNIS